MSSSSHLRGFALFLGLIATGPTAFGADEPPIGRGVGTRVENFSLPNVLAENDPKSISLYDFRGKKAAVIFFGATDCPVGNLYMPRLVELARQYRDKGVVFLLINANAHEPAAEVARQARSFGVDFPVLKDAGNVVADQLLARRTCETLVLDGHATIRYRGALDDQYGLGSRKDAPTKRFVVDALDAILADREIDTTATTVIGCPIDRTDSKPSTLGGTPRVRPAPAEVVKLRDEMEKAEKIEVGTVTYAADVAPILQAKCQNCHRPKEVGPFSLLSYDDARRWATSIVEVVEDRRMPPWHADPRYGHFSNDRSLTARDRAILLAWVAQKEPLGDPKAIPEARSFPEGWSVGTPDVVFSIPEQTIQATGTVAYQNFRIPTRFAEDKWVQVIEARPGNRSVVHHIVVYLVRKGDQPEHLGGYAPGDMPSVYEAGIAKKIPAGAELMLQLHYTPTGKVTTDQSVVGLTFAKVPPTRRAITRGIAQPRFEIPAGAENHEVRSSMTFRDDSHLLAFMPHMHLRGKDFSYTAVYPDGRREMLLSVPAYDFAFQSYYRLTEPKAMPKGTKIECLAHFDNSTANPSNPDPKSPVRWGEQTWEEMMIGYVDYVPDAPIDPTPSKPVASLFPSTARQLLRILSTRAQGVSAGPVVVRTR